PLTSNEENPEDPVVLEGEECQPQAQECAPWLVCTPAESGFTCERALHCLAGDVGDPCGDEYHCAEGNFCALSCSDGSEGARCLSTSQCHANLICDEGVCTSSPAGGECPCANGQ